MPRVGESPGDLIFCGGVHGVGKTSLCRALADEIHAVHLSAGSLLRFAELVKPGQYAVPDFRPNQAYIQSTLQHYREQHRGARIVLDGHFCLLSLDQKIQVLPCELFKSLSVTALLVVVDDPSATSRRLADRDGTSLDGLSVERLQRREVARARAISRHLGVPLRNVRPSALLVDIAQWILDMS